MITPTAQTAAEAICRAAGVTTADALKGCIYDVVVTGDKSFASAAAKSDVSPLPPTPPAPQVIVDYVQGVWHVGEPRTFTARVLNSSAIPTWEDPGPGLTLVRNPNDPYRVTLTPTLAGCYTVDVSILVNGIVYRNFYQFSYDVDRGNCNQT